MLETHILIVDDEQHVLQSLSRALHAEPYILHLASGAEQGLDLLKQQPCKVVLSDQQMPGRQGLEFIREVKEIQPKAVCILLTGKGSLELYEEAFFETDVFNLLLKPWDTRQLKAAVRSAVLQFGQQSEQKATDWRHLRFLK
ncbi:response regulator [Trichlorobacter lovleyi]|uniref:response regulator n=1 Tax=Trichlorobacter lovleyi TaxID=313985 RepID=UPI00067405C1|nr:response regulator [Trichlorobacter lovleyi]